MNVKSILIIPIKMSQLKIGEDIFVRCNISKPRADHRAENFENGRALSRFVVINKRIGT